MKNLLAKVSSGHSNHFPKFGDGAAVVVAFLGTLLENAFCPIFCDNVVPHELIPKEREGNGVLDEDSVLLCLAHECSLTMKREFVDFNWTPGFNFTSMDARP